MFGLSFHYVCFALCMIYIYIYLFKDGRVICMIDSRGQEGTPLVIMGAVNLGCGYAFKAIVVCVCVCGYAFKVIAVDAYSCKIVCMIVAA